MAERAGHATSPALALSSTSNRSSETACSRRLAEPKRLTASNLKAILPSQQMETIKEKSSFN
uniref:Uncharacterized protein n=1 Tax=Arundo donax TaxID=35708 RepID=A0A0A9AXV3_ARUDO